MLVPRVRLVDPRLLRHARGARTFVAACAALGVLTGGLVLAQADLLAALISRAFLDGAGIAELTVLLALLATVVLARAAVSWLSETAAHRASAGVLTELRAAVVRRALETGPRRHAGRSPAELATLATRGMDRLDGYFARYLPQLLIAAVVPAVVGGRILLADPVAAVIIAATVPLIPLFMILIGLHTQRATRRQWRALSVLGNHFLDLVAGLSVLTAFGRARAQRRTLAEITNRYRVRTMRTLRVAFLSALVLELLATLSVALVAVSVGLRLVSGDLDLHTALVVLILAPEVYLPLRAVGARFHDSAEGLAAAEEILEVLEERPSGTVGRSPAPGAAPVPVRLQEITVNGRSGPVLDGLTLDIRAGEVVGVTGPSGAGKSTLLDLLLGWYPPDAGSVLAGGVDLSSVDLSGWRARVSWVPQQPRLLAGTVADNIRLGAPDATDDQVRRAATLAALDVPLWTVVGELGAGLSTGQQRRVALARAALLDRPLLLLDEPTEGVDADTERAILDGLPALLAGRTAVIVTHRGSVLEVCDRVVSLPGPVGVAPASPAPAAPDAAPPAARSAGRPRWALLALACLAGAAALGSGVALTATSAWLISAAALHPPVLTLMVAIVAVRTFGLAKGVLRYAERLLSHDVALRALADLRVRVWDSLVRAGPAVTARMRRGDLLSRLVSDVDNQQDVLVRGLVPAVSAALVTAGTVIGIGMLLPEAGLVVLIGLIVAGVFAPAVSVLAAQRAERRISALRAEVAAGTVEVLGAAPELIAFGAVARRHAVLRSADAALNGALRRSAVARAAGTALGTLAIGLTSLVCLLVGIAAVRAGRLPGPELAVLALTPLATAELVAFLPDAAARLLTARHSARRLAELAALPAPVTEPVATLEIRRVTGLSAAGLSVRWPGSETDAVRGLNVHTSAVLAGPSGAGKSTALAAIMRYLDPSAGRIMLDGVDTRLVSSDATRSMLGWCGPDTHLFDGTLRANLRLARPAASDAELRAALRRARLGGWLDSLPDGLDTPLGAHGTGVSGGERQRLGIARALLADRPVLLLDEPTAHLDGATAMALAADLRSLTAGRPVLIVTHRPAEFPDLPVITVARTPALTAAR